MTIHQHRIWRWWHSRHAEIFIEHSYRDSNISWWVCPNHQRNWKLRTF